MEVSFVKTLRDLIIFRITETYLTVSCDSCGGIGFHPLDTVKVDGKILGKFLARVALMETLSVNARPFVCSLAFSINPSPMMREILGGIQEEFRTAGLKERDVKFILSSEKNFPVRQTGVSITVLGITKNLKIGRVKNSDLLIAVGKPYVGGEVLQAEANREIAELKDLNKLLKMNFVHELIPVGSRGILYEAKVLAKSSELNFKLGKPTIDIKKSAGPSTVILAAVRKDMVGMLTKSLDKPIEVIGVFI